MTSTKNRRTVLAASCAAVALLAACSSSSSGKPQQASSGPSSPSVATSSTPSTASSAPATSGTPTSAAPTSTAPGGTAALPRTAAALGALLDKGLTSFTSARLSFTVTSTQASTAKTQTETGTGAIRLSGGRTVASSIDTGSTKQIIVGGKVYLQDPGLKSSKPWVLATTTSSNPVLRAEAKAAATTAQTGTGGGSTYAAAASSVILAGTQTLDGTTVGKYIVTVDVAKLPASNAQRKLLLAAKLSSFQILQYVDALGRTHRVDQTLTVGGITTTSTYLINSFNTPVTISAPPADEVTTQ